MATTHSAPVFTVGCPVCGMLTDVRGSFEECPQGHRFEVLYCSPESGRPTPVSTRALPEDEAKRQG